MCHLPFKPGTSGRTSGTMGLDIFKFLVYNDIIEEKKGINMKNYYEILEVNQKASKEVIEKAYKVLVKKYHPDLHSNSKQTDMNKKIREINEAYEVLSNEFLREQYNLELEKQNINQTNNAKKTKTDKNSENKEIEEFNERMKKHKVGSFLGLIELLKELYKNKPKRNEFKEITKKDIIALVLTIVVIILIGIILWYIPFTNGWMRELLFENTIFNWIGGLFNF